MLPRWALWVHILRFVPARGLVCTLQANQAELKKQMDAMRAELGTALTSQLSPAELADLSRLGPELDRLQASPGRHAVLLPGSTQHVQPLCMLHFSSCMPAGLLTCALPWLHCMCASGIFSAVLCWRLQPL